MCVGHASVDFWAQLIQKHTNYVLRNAILIQDLPNYVPFGT